jgi:hypothetical protein
LAPEANVTVTILGDFRQFLSENGAFLTRCYDQAFAHTSSIYGTDANFWPTKLQIEFITLIPARKIVWGQIALTRDETRENLVQVVRVVLDGAELVVRPHPDHLRQRRLRREDRRL